MDHWAVLEKLAVAGVKFQVNHDVHYGIDGRSGWSVTVNGRVLAELMPTAKEAIEAAILNALARA